MLLRFSNFVTLSLILAEHMANAHGDHDHDHEHHHGHSHVHHDAPRRLGIFGNPSNRPCKDGEETFVVGGVTYECREDFNEKGGQCRSPDRTPEEKAKAKNDFKAWKEEKSKKVKRKGGERRLAEGCGDCVDWDTQVITIPTYFHVIHSGTTGRKYTYEGYSDSNPDYIQNQVKALNLGFRGDVSEFPPNKNGRSYDRFDINAADTKIQFCLMGTTASNDSTWYADKGSTHLSYKRALDVGGMETLNIYANTAHGYLGYAYFPTNSDSDYDGVVILNDSMPGGPTGIYSEGDTLTHEVGHWLGLEHTHQGGCSGPGDYMDEAPPGDGYGTTKATESTATFNCPVGLDNCSADGGKKNPIHNFMSYSEDNCMDQFTPGQKVNLQQAWETYRHKAGYSENISLAQDGYSCLIPGMPTTSPTEPQPTGTPTSKPTKSPVVITSKPTSPTACAIKGQSCSVNSDCCKNNCQFRRGVGTCKK